MGHKPEMGAIQPVRLYGEGDRSVTVTPEGKLSVDAQVTAEVADSKIKGSTDAGTTWVPVRVNSSGQLEVTLSGRLAADGLTLAEGGNVVAQNMLYNGSTLDLARGNTEGVLFPSAARSHYVTSSIQTNPNARGIVLHLNVTEAGATGYITVQLRYVDPATGSSDKIIWESPQINTATMHRIVIYPGAASTSASGVYVASVPIPRRWAVSVANNGGASWTYSLGFGYIL